MGRKTKVNKPAYPRRPRIRCCHLQNENNFLQSTKLANERSPITSRVLEIPTAGHWGFYLKNPHLRELYALYRMVTFSMTLSLARHVFFAHLLFQIHDDRTQTTKTQIFDPFPTQPNPTRGSTQPTDNSVRAYTGQSLAHPLPLNRTSSPCGRRTRRRRRYARSRFSDCCPTKSATCVQ